MTLTIKELKNAKNIAELLDDQELSSIGMQVYNGYDNDENSRSEWKELLDKAMDIAKQTMQTKNHPWPNASNVKYPLITKAAIDYAARSYPAIIQGNKVVRASIVGNDPDHVKSDRAARVARFMNYQLLGRDEEWEDGFDKMLHILPIVGTTFKKTYYNTLLKQNVSELCNPDKVVVNYNTKTLESARRITHILDFYTNDIIERIRSGLYSEIDLTSIDDETADGYSEDDSDAPAELLECHCYLDLDDDGYQEPYIVTIHKASRQVLRIVNRFGKISKNGKGEIKRIEPKHYFTDYHFIRSPDGGFYSVGLGQLLYPINEAINTLINQLIDAGTLNNSQGGFLGRGLRLKNGEFKLKLGEWKVLDAASGTHLAQNIVPLPTKEPSGTLFQLLGLLIQMGKDLVSANDATEGKGQTQNVATGTLDQMLEQGLKVYNAISKRFHRSLKKEFRKLYELNQEHLTNEEYFTILDDAQADKTVDFGLEDMDIIPVSDPELSSTMQRLQKAQVISQIPGVDPYEASREMLAALQVDPQRIQQLLPQPDPNAPPPPELQKTAAEIEKLSAEAKFKIVEADVISENQMMKAAELNLKRDEAAIRTEEATARIAKMKSDGANNTAKVELAGGKAQHQASMSEMNILHKREKDQVELSIKAADTMSKAESKSSKKEE